MIVVALCALACAAIFLGTLESAFGATLRLPFRLLSEHDDEGRQLQAYLDDPVALYVPSRLLLSGVVVLATMGFASLWGGDTLRALGAVFAATVAFVLICQLVMPWLIARRDPERVLGLMLPSFAIVARLLRPLTDPVTRVATRRERRGAMGLNGDGTGAPRAVGNGAGDDDEAGFVEGEDRRLLRSIVDFGDTLVKEVMTPRPDVVAVSVSATLDDLRTLLREEQYSRIPVYGENLDEIVGIVFIKDLIRLTGAENAETPEPSVAELMRPANLVPETKRVAELLREFQLRQGQMAIVVDEYGGTAGLVTLEDLIEEIVGEIRDEYDTEEAVPIVEEAGHVFLMNGLVDIGDMAARLGVRIEKEGFETVGGYVLARLGRVPSVGESFDLDGVTVEVLEAQERRVIRVRVSRKTTAHGAPASAP